jgi:catechol 2,3-dioxygenase-like lactoylglutathione lyase family enzyme
VTKEKNTAVSRLHVHVAVDDLERSVAFYCAVLAAACRAQMPSGR